MRILTIYRKPANLKPEKDPSPAPRTWSGSRVAILFVSGMLIGPPAHPAQDGSIHRDWRRQIALTTRILLQREVGNPFATPLESGPESTRPADALSGQAIRSGTVGAGLPGLATGAQPELAPAQGLADWDWRERLRWFQTWGASPASSTGSATAAGTIEASTSSFWWFQNPFSAP